jgi:hypothetical protein
VALRGIRALRGGSTRGMVRAAHPRFLPPVLDGT